MAQISTEPTTAEMFLGVLTRAAQVRELHEKEPGERDSDWPQGYAECVVRPSVEARRGRLPHPCIRRGRS
ncbi:MAG: hypothetical protein ABSC94_24025 [Polyangiaceae bacterium]|jgi:hypothetical protein